MAPSSLLAGHASERLRPAHQLIPIGLINWAIDANYFFICRKPGGESPFLIGEWPYYLIGFEILCLVFFGLVSLPMWRLGRRADEAE